MTGPSIIGTCSLCRSYVVVDEYGAIKCAQCGATPKLPVIEMDKYPARYPKYQQPKYTWETTPAWGGSYTIPSYVVDYEVHLQPLIH